jgi:GT2 family glycosyltransferase
MQAAGAQALVDVVIINYNAGEALIRCVRSVMSQDMPIRITVSDNASTDGSVEALERALGDVDGLSIVRNERNLGFARGVNEVVSQMDCRAEFLLILNPDCEMRPGSLAELVGALDLDPGAALAGPAVIDDSGHIMRGTLRRFPDPWKSFLTFSGLTRLQRWIPAFSGVEVDARLPAGTVSAEAVSGACMLIRQSAFNAIDGMDSSYGLHCEDLDLMYRFRLGGFRCLYVPLARVFHEQGISSSSRPLWVHWQKHLGMQRFFRKFQAGRRALPVRWLVISGIWLRFALTLPLVLLRR